MVFNDRYYKNIDISLDLSLNCLYNGIYKDFGRADQLWYPNII